MIASWSPAPASTAGRSRRRSGVDVVEVRPRVTTDDAEAALRLAIEGAGIIRLSDVIVGGPLRDGELVALLTDIHHVEPFPLSAIYPAGRQRLPRVAVFLEFWSGAFRPRAVAAAGIRCRRGQAGTLSLSQRRRPRFDQRPQRQQRRGIGDAVDPRRTEMALECGDDVAGGVVVTAGVVDAVAVIAQACAAGASPSRRGRRA